MAVEVGQVYQESSSLAALLGATNACGWDEWKIVAVRRRNATLKREADGVMKTVPLAKLASSRWRLMPRVG